MAEIRVRVSVDKSELIALQTDLKNQTYKLNVTATSNGVTQAASDTRNLDTSVQSATRSVSDLGTAFVSKVKWGLIQTSIAAVGQAFKTAINNMKEVDTQIVNVAKVTGQSLDQLSGLSDKAYSTASKYGVDAGKYMEAVYEYTKAGFKDNADQMGELSTKAMLVGDTTAAIADKFLIAGNAAFGFGGNIQKLSMMVDQADYINNNYATTLDKIAEGFPRVASVANMAGMTAEETMAALGTITATTQETASRASTALRALILNILGDTNTEIEDGVTATAETVEGLRDALQKYAPEVVRAADATGKLINPMKALKSLSEAYKNGDLTERGLFEIESALGGKLRTNQLDALLKNFDMYEEMLTGMGSAAGTADKEIGIMLESWESKAKILENTWTEFVSKSFNSDFFKGFITGLTDIIKLFGDLGTAIATAGGAFAAFKMFKTSSGLGNVTQGLSAEITGIKNQISTLNQSMSSTALQMQQLWTPGKKGFDLTQYKAMSDQMAVMRTQSTALRADLKNMQAQYEATANKAFNLQAVAGAVAGLTTIYTVVSMIQNAIDQARQKQMEAANEASANVASLATSYSEYQAAVIAANEGTAGSMAVVETAADSLREALKEVGVAGINSAEDVETAFARTMTVLRNQIEQGVSASEGALKDAFQRVVSTQGNGTLEALYPFVQAMGTPTIDALFAKGDSAEDIVKYYEWFIDAQNLLKESGKEASNEYKVFGGIIAELSPVVEEYRGQLAQLDKLKVYEGIQKNADAFRNAANMQELMARRSEFLNKYGIQSEEAVAALDEYIRSVAESNQLMERSSNLSATEEDRINKRAQAYETLADRIEEANVALENYNVQTQDQQGSEYTQYVNAYEAFLEDWEKGFKGSTNVKAAEELFFTNEQITAMRKKGIEVGEVLASDFYQSLFTHMEENGREFNKEDMGAYAAFALFDDTEGKNLAEGYTRAADQIIDAHGHLVAEFEHGFDEQGNEEIKVITHNIELLADALGVAPEMVAAWVDAWGVFDSSIEATAEDITKLASAYGALSELNGAGVIDVSQFIQGLGEAGAQAGQLWDYVERLKELQSSGDLQLNMDLNTDEGNERVAELIDHYATADDEPLQAEVETDQAKSEIDSLSAYGNSQVIRPIVSAPTESARSALDGLKSYGDSLVIRPTVEVSTKFDKQASGTDDAPGGLTLVNEGTGINAGPEIIVENGKARIAGGGKPTLTVVDKGATIFNAQETRKIFERSGINAFANGYETGGIKRPSGSQTNSSDDSGSTSPQTYAPPVDTTPPQITPDEDIEARTEALKEQVALMESLAKKSEAANSSVAMRVKREQAVAQALMDQILYMKETGQSQTEINNLYVQYYNALNNIKELQEDERKKTIEKAADRVELLESELDLLEAQDKPINDQIRKQRSIANAIGKQVDAARAAGASQQEINQLLLDQVEAEKKVAELRQEKKEQRLERAGNRVDRLQSELKILEAQDASYGAQIKKQRSIANAIGRQIKAARAAGASQKEINELLLAQIEAEKKVEDLEQEKAEAKAKKLEDKANARADEATLLKSEYDLLEALGKSSSRRIKKQKEIRDAITAEIRALKKIEGSEAEINRLKVERLEIDKKIKELEMESAKEALEKQNDRVSLLKSQLTLIELQDSAVKDRILKQREIASGILKEIRLMKKAGATQEEINQKQSEYYNVTKQIAELENSLYDNLKSAVQNQIEEQNKLRDAELEKLKEEHDLTDKTAELEERMLAVEEARENLRKAEEERTVRIYNAAKDEWEWVANAQNIESARKSLEDAESALTDYQKDQEYETREAEINAKYDGRIEQWQNILDFLADPEISIAEALSDLEKNATKSMKKDLRTLNTLLAPLGERISLKGLYDSGGILKGVGGIKATRSDEMVLPPDLTRAMLTPVQSPVFDQRMDELRYMYGLSQSNSGAGAGGNQINGDVYQYGNITLTESQARSTTVYELAKMSRGLRSFVATGR